MITQTFREFSHLHFDTSSSTGHKLLKFWTDCGKWPTSNGRWNHNTTTTVIIRTDHYIMSRKISVGCSIALCLAIFFSQIILVWHFQFETFSICIIFQNSWSNFVNLWSVIVNKVSKCWQKILKFLYRSYRQTNKIMA